MMKCGFPGAMSIGLIACAFASTDVMAGTCRVKVDGCGCSTTCTGANWTSQCFEFLQDALADSSCTEIWVAAGTYVPVDCDPTCDDDDRDATFDVGGGNGPKVYGGFVGTESTLGARSLKCYDGTTYDGTCPCVSGEVCLPDNETILSGDLEDDDGCKVDGDCAAGETCDTPSGLCTCTDTSDCPAGYACTGTPTKYCVCDGDDDCGTDNYCVGGRCLKGENSFHVVSCHHLGGGTPRLDGFIIEGGKADGNGPFADPPALDNQGAAIQIRAGTKYCQDPANNEWAAPLVACPATACIGDDTCEFFPCFSGGLDVSNCMIHHNFASNHGAVNDHFAVSTFDNCYFHHNQAAKGGALLVDNGSPSITDCVFEDNKAGETAPREGGAIWLGGRDGTSGCPSDPAPTITDTTFVGNIATGGGSPGLGGALYAAATAPVLSGCIFDSNEIQGLGGALPRYSGGAIWIKNIPSSPGAKITSSLFIDNIVDLTQHLLVSGGAIAQFGPGELNIDNTSFVRNDGRGNGGALAIWFDATTTCTNCLFTGNIIGDGGLGYGSAVLIYEPTGAAQTVNVDLTNCTFVANYNDYLNGPLIRVVDQAGGSNVSVTNCIFWNNNPNSDMDDLAEYEYSIIDGCSPSCGTTNLDADPKFLADADDCDDDGWGDPPCSSGCGTGCDDYGDPRLGVGSPAIDTGDNCAIDFDGDGSTSDDVPYDLDGRDRRVDDPGTTDGGNTDCDPDTDVTAPMVDRGAYEFQCTDDSDCAGGEVCCSNVCVSGDCCDDTDCTGGESCYNNVCNACDVHRNCTGSLPYCCLGTCKDCCAHQHCGGGTPYCCLGSCQATTCFGIP